MMQKDKIKEECAKKEKLLSFILLIFQPRFVLPEIINFIAAIDQEKEINKKTRSAGGAGAQNYMKNKAKSEAQKSLLFGIS